jgi:hypothetical protein
LGRARQLVMKATARGLFGVKEERSI